MTELDTPFLVSVNIGCCNCSNGQVGLYSVGWAQIVADTLLHSHHAPSTNALATPHPHLLRVVGWTTGAYATLIWTTPWMYTLHTDCMIK